jgi:hypothetical protein
MFDTTNVSLNHGVSPNFRFAKAKLPKETMA